MSRKNVILTSLCFLTIAGLYVYIYRDMFRRPVIHISHTHERNLLRRGSAPQTPHPVFSLGQDYRLTLVEVVPLDEFKADPNIPPLWELDSKAGSTPTKIFSYGSSIAGMHLADPNAPIGQLSNNVAYRLIVKAGRIKGEHDFTLTDQDYPDNAAQ